MYLLLETKGLDVLLCLDAGILKVPSAFLNKSKSLGISTYTASSLLKAVSLLPF